MDVSALAVKLKIQEISIPWCNVLLKGKLFAAIPCTPKPRGFSAVAWAVDLLRATKQFGSCRLVVPSSLCSSDTSKLLEQTGMGEINWIDLMDHFKGFNDFDGYSPIDAVQKIIDALNVGEDVIILSGTKKISGFVPAIISKIIATEVHAVKVWYPIVGKGYALTPFQLGYIYGLSDAGSSSDLKYIRERLSICAG